MAAFKSKAASVIGAYLPADNKHGRMTSLKCWPWYMYAQLHISDLSKL